VSAPRTTSGVLAVVAAGLIATPASAADGAVTNATTALTPPTLTDALDAVTTPKAAETPAPAPAPTTEAAPTTTATTPAPTKPAPTTTGTTPAKPSDPKDPSVGDDSGGQGRDNAKAARERRQRAAERQRTAKERREARADRREKRREDRAKREAEEREAKKAREDAARGEADTTTGDATAPAGVTTSGLDADALLQAPTAVPNFFLDNFRIPPFLLPIYQAAGVQYGVRWEILAAINEIETNFGRNLNVSTAGALGWMQFMPPTWASYGVDANGDDQADPYNPVDAIFAAARYLKAAGAETDIRKAIFAYNHADWYVDSVMVRARLISGLPADLVGSLTGLTQGVFPVSGDATYAGAPKSDDAQDDGGDGSTALDTSGDAAEDESDTDDAKGEKSGPRRSITIDAQAGSDAVAVQDGTVTGLGESERLGRYVQLRDVFGNRYTYAHLDEVAKTYPAPADDAPQGDAAATDALDIPKDPAPSAPATAGRQRRAGEDAKGTGSGSARTDATGSDATGSDAASADAAGNTTAGDIKSGATKQAAVKHGALTEDGTAAATTPSAPSASTGPRLAPKPLFANPRRDGSRWGTAERPTTTAKTPAPGDLSATDPSATPPAAPKPAPATEEELPVSREGLVDRPLQRGARIVGGTVLGTVGRKPDTTETETESKERRAKMTFGVRPAGKGAPQVDPKPLLDGWKLLASTEVYRAKGENPLFGSGGSTASAGQVLLMSKAQLERRVLADDRLDIYPVGRQQIQAGQIDRRVLATLAFLSANGHRIGVSSLRRPGSITSAGNVSEHDSGNAIDISTVDGQVISGKTQGAGTVTERTIRLLLQLQGTMKPHQIISLMTASDFGGADNILPLPDHADHIHVGFHVEDNGSAQLGQQLASALKPAQWDDLIAQLGKIENPDVPTKVSKYALKTKRTKKDK
jgi:hypothetical protein